MGQFTLYKCLINAYNAQCEEREKAVGNSRFGFISRRIDGKRFVLETVYLNKNNKPFGRWADVKTGELIEAPFVTAAMESLGIQDASFGSVIVDDSLHFTTWTGTGGIGRACLGSMTLTFDSFKGFVDCLWRFQKSCESISDLANERYYWGVSEPNNELRVEGMINGGSLRFSYNLDFLNNWHRTFSIYASAFTTVMGQDGLSKEEMEFLAAEIYASKGYGSFA